jgi:hypothetical protein
MSAAPAIFGVGWSAALLVVSVAVPALTDDRSLDRRGHGRGPFVAALLVGVALVAAGLVLWLPAGRKPDVDSDLGSALLGGVTVAFAVLFLQWRFELSARERDRVADESQRDRDEAADRARRLTDEAAAGERRRQDDRQHAQLLTALHDDLTGVDLRGRDLSGFYLRGRILERAKLDGARLDGANVARANLRGATLGGAWLERSAYLEATFLPGADLEGAHLANAYLEGADLTGASLAGADLENADLSATDLRACDLTDALNTDSANFTGARYDGETHWAADEPPGAIEIDSDDPWRCAAATAQAE